MVDAGRDGLEPAPTPAPGAVPEAAPGAARGLSERDLAVLAFERRTWRHRGAKEQAVRDAFDLSATRYYQVLNALIDDPAALAADPLLVQRLRRVRDTRVPGSAEAAPPGP